MAGVKSNAVRCVGYLEPDPPSEFANFAQLWSRGRLPGKSALRMTDKGRQRLQSLCDQWVDGFRHPSVHSWDKTQYGGRFTNTVWAFRLNDDRFLGFCLRTTSEGARPRDMLVFVHARAKHQREYDEATLDAILACVDEPWIIRAAAQPVVLGSGKEERTS